MSLVTQTGHSSPDGHWTQQGCECESVLVLQPHPKPACASSLQEAVGCSPPQMGCTGCSSQSWWMLSGAGGFLQEWVGVHWGEPWGQSWGQPAPACPVPPCVCADTPGTLPGKWPLLVPPLQQHCIPPVGHRDRQLGGLFTLLHFGYRSQGVKFAMPAPPSAGDFFSPRHFPASQSGSASVLFT